MADIDWEELMDKTSIPWTEFTEEEFITFYWQVVAPIAEAEGLDPRRPPPTSFMRNHGFERYRAAIDRHFGRTLHDFLVNEVGLDEATCNHEYHWPIDDSETKQWLDDFVIDLRERDSSKEKESTIGRIARNLYIFLQEWVNAHSHSEIVSTLKEVEEDEAYQLVLAVYDRINKRVPSENTKCRYLTDHSFWFEFLCYRGNPLDYNPIPDVGARFRWKRTHTDPMDRPSLSPEQVKRLWESAETIEEKMIVIASCAWGLRTGEIATLHVDQLSFEPDEDVPFTGPVVAFEERKAGPSVVNMIYGREIAEERISNLQEKYGDDWNGYLFPSRDSRSEHLRGKSILQGRYKPMANRADIKVDGKPPNVKHARRFWYQEYRKGMERYMQLLAVVAAEQGSKDPVVVRRNYLGEEDQIRFARQWMREQLETAFGDSDLNREPLENDSFHELVKECLNDILSDEDHSTDPTRDKWLEDESGRAKVRGLVPAVLMLFTAFTWFTLLPMIW